MGLKALLKRGKRGEIRRAPLLPAGLRLYVIGDIHGRFDLLQQVQEKIAADLAESGEIEHVVEIYLGDYVDRGLQSPQVVDCLLAPVTGRERIFLKGNHEATLLAFLEDAKTFDAWRNFGGVETLRAYGVPVGLVRGGNDTEQIRQAFVDRLPPAHLHFFRSLKLSATFGHYFFAHAGVRPGVPLTEQREADLLWIREAFLDSTADHGKIVVHGHSPVPQPEIWPNRINIDTGAYLTNRLTCLVLEGDEQRCL